MKTCAKGHRTSWSPARPQNKSKVPRSDNNSIKLFNFFPLFFLKFWTLRKKNIAPLLPLPFPKAPPKESPKNLCHSPLRFLSPESTAIRNLVNEGKRNRTNGWIPFLPCESSSSLFPSWWRRRRRSIRISNGCWTASPLPSTPATTSALSPRLRFSRRPCNLVISADRSPLSLVTCWPLYGSCSPR